MSAREGLTPEQLDMAINGAKVFIYRRPADSTVYASVYDFSRFNVKPLEMVRVPIKADSTRESIEADAKVLRAIKRHTKAQP